MPLTETQNVVDVIANNTTRDIQSVPQASPMAAPSDVGSTDANTTPLTWRASEGKAKKAFIWGLTTFDDPDAVFL